MVVLLLIQNTCCHMRGHILINNMVICLTILNDGAGMPWLNS